MKKGLILIVLAIMSMTYISCEKPKTEPEKDYREKWEGTYDCEKILYSYIEQVTLDITIPDDSVLHISERVSGLYSPLDHVVKVAIDGSFSSTSGDVSGFFYTDSLYVVWIAPSMKDFKYNGKKLKTKER